ncbi:TPA: M15 family metallopeptidase [Klebsiella michiganensis]
MNDASFDSKSDKLIREVHPKLRGLMNEAIRRSGVRFIITEGLRTKKRQLELLAQGKSLTQNSRHLTGHAVDVAILHNNKVTWEFKYYKALASCIKSIASEMKIDIVWGGDWENIRDGAHFELKRSD